jgi:hypothetical protein
MLAMRQREIIMKWLKLASLSLVIACSNTHSSHPSSVDGEVDSTELPGLSEGYPIFRVVVDSNLDGYHKALVRDSLKDWSNSTRCMQWFIEYRDDVSIKDVYERASKFEDEESYTIYFVAGLKQDFPDKTKGIDWDGQGTYYTKENHAHHTGYAFVDVNSIDERTDRLVRHELGHAMGISHNLTNPYSIMFVNKDIKNLKVLQVADVWQFRDFWGCNE